MQSVLRGALASQSLDGLPLILIVDDSAFCSRTLNNFLWVTFTPFQSLRMMFTVLIVLLITNTGAAMGR